MAVEGNGVGDVQALHDHEAHGVMGAHEGDGGGFVRLG
jgi:hypothetical protein